MDLFESLVSKIEAANEYYECNHSAIHTDLYHCQKILGSNHIFHNNAGESKAKKIAERELRRPWVRLGVNYKTMVILEFLREFKNRHPTINQNQIIYDMMMLLSQSRASEINVDYDSEAGKIKLLFGYEVVDHRIVKSVCPEKCLSNKFILRLRPKVTESTLLAQ